MARFTALVGCIHSPSITTLRWIDIATSPQRKGPIRLDAGKQLVADVILIAAGRVGATDDLNLPAVGLTADGRGRLPVDDHYRTTQPHIHAAGDVIGFPALAATSSEQGRLAACHMFGLPAEPMGTHFPGTWTDRPWIPSRPSTVYAAADLEAPW